MSLNALFFILLKILTMSNTESIFNCAHTKVEIIKPYSIAAASNIFSKALYINAQIVGKMLVVQIDSKTLAESGPRRRAGLF